MRTLARLAAQLAGGLVLVALISYLSARSALGNPLAGLGPGGYLPPEVEEALRKTYGLDEPLLPGLLHFLQGLLRGDTGTSLLYTTPALKMVVARLPYTLIPMATGFAIALAALYAWVRIRGCSAPLLVRVLAHIPGYFYAITLYILVWNIGLPRGDAIDTIYYALIVALAVWPRLLHTLSGLAEESETTERLYTAIGASASTIRIKCVRVVAAPLALYASGLLASMLERSVLLEPLLGYPGVGYLLYRGVFMSDPVLAATSFTILGTLGYLFIGVGRITAMLLDPRLRA